MMAEKYSHRNGEAELPTVYEAYYWFQANEGSRWEATWGCYYVMPPYGDEGAYISDSHTPLAELEGLWWGPAIPPWEQTNA